MPRGIVEHLQGKDARMSEPKAVPRFDSFEEFWPYYVREHAKKTTRMLHFVGTTGAMVSVAAALFSKKRALLLAAPVVGYGLAWIGHFFVEKNRPATFTYPLWSLRGDMHMWWRTLNGTMDAEVDRVLHANGAHDVESTGAHASPADPQTLN